jgi:hypothetical protein
MVDAVAGHRSSGRTRASGDGQQSRAKRPGEPAPRSKTVDGRTVVILALLQHGNGPGASLSRTVVERVREALDSLDPANRSNVILDVWLESPGGDADCAYKIGLILRSVATRIRVVVPDYAKSAATLLSLVADEIYMAPAAELGPLDAQIGYEQEGMTISALDRARSLDDLTTTAMDIALAGGAAVLESTRLSRAETISAMLDFAAKFLQPVVAKLDPTMLHWSNTLLRVAVEYGRRLMLTREDCPRELAARIPSQLLEEYPTHGFVISIQEAEDLGLPVKPLAEYEFANEVKAAYTDTQTRQANLIGVVPTPSTADSTVESEQGDEVDDGARGNGRPIE